MRIATRITGALAAPRRVHREAPVVSSALAAAAPPSALRAGPPTRVLAAAALLALWSGAGLPARALAAAATAPPAASPASGVVSKSAGMCGVCHPTERVQHQASRHAAEEVTCVDCHGGNARSLEKAAAHGAGFRGRIGKASEPPLCATCHADVARMRPYDLPVDQLALYQTSGHGRLLARGDTRVAVCSSCHSAHEIRSASDPASATFVLNVARTCGTCHGDSTLMARRPEAGRAWQDYRQSAHAKALFEKGNRQAPTCVSCHGVHGAAPAAVGDVGKVCGHCHTTERRWFAAGAHGRGMAAKGFSQCASCHGDHAVEAAQPAKLETQCSTCHGPASMPDRLGRAMYQRWRHARDELDRAAATIEKAARVPLRTEDYEARLEEGRTYLSEALPAAHGLDSTEVIHFASRAASVGEEIRSELDEKLAERTWGYVGLALFWFYVILTLLVIRRFRGRGATGA
jgi:hypothetical protein